MQAAVSSRAQLVAGDRPTFDFLSLSLSPPPDILKAVALRTRVLQEYLVDEYCQGVQDPDDEARMDQIAEHLDNIRDAEGDYLSVFSEKKRANTILISPAKVSPECSPDPSGGRPRLESWEKPCHISFSNRHDLDGHTNEASKLVSLLDEIWTVRELKELNQDEKLLFDIADG